MKICRKCNCKKPVSDFWKKTDTSDGLDTRCKLCAYIQNKKWREKNREAINAYNRDWKALNPMKVKERDLKYYSANRKRISVRNKKSYAAAGLARSRKRKYGVSEETVEQMHLTQGGACAICKVVPKTQLHVDHDHSTGKVRALLCRNCNLALGYLKDSADAARAAAEYLDAFKQNID